jgi:hypothetical protein
MVEWMYRSTFFLTTALVSEWWGSRSDRFTPWESAPGTYWIGSWVDPRTGLDDVEKRKFLNLPGLELQALGRPTRSQRYTDYSIVVPRRTGTMHLFQCILCLAVCLRYCNSATGSSKPILFSLKPKDLQKNLLNTGYIFHFCVHRS